MIAITGPMSKRSTRSRCPKAWRFLEAEGEDSAMHENSYHNSSARKAHALLELDEIDPISVKILQNSDSAVWRVQRAFGEFHASLPHRIVVGVEIVCLQEEKDTATGTVADTSPLPVVHCSRK